jgi:hypothetical protein
MRRARGSVRSAVGAVEGAVEVLLEYLRVLGTG